MTDSTANLESSATLPAILGYLNFSEGKPDARFQKQLSDAYQFLTDRATYRSTSQQVLGAVNLWCFAQNATAPLSDQKIGGDSQRRICRHSTIAIGTAAVGSQN